MQTRADNKEEKGITHITNVPLIHVYTENLKSQLLNHVRTSGYVLGCVAWVTDYEILDALASLRGVTLLVQTENFLTRNNKNDQVRFFPMLCRAPLKGPRWRAFCS